MILCCTSKLLRELGIRVGLRDLPASSGALDTWFANLLRIDRRKCLLFTNAQTLYSFVVPGIRRSDLTDLSGLFLINLARSLETEGLSINDLTGFDTGPAVITRTNSRSVLGSMNELAYLCEGDILSSGGLGNCDLDDVHRRLNRVPLSAIGYDYAIERLREAMQLR